MNLALRIGVLIAAVLQIAVPAFVNPFSDGEDAVRAGPSSQIEPAGYAFSIWGPIYFLALGYAVWQLLPAGRADPVTARIAPLALPLYLGSSLWLFAAAEYLPLWLTMPILGAMAACAATALIIGMQTRTASLWRLALVAVGFGMYAAWTLCATFVNIAEVAPQYGFDRFGLSPPLYSALSIAAATALAVLVLWRTGGALAFALTVVWALVAIIVSAQTRGYDGIVVIAAASALGVVAVLTGVLKLAPMGALQARTG
jgi:hypothetical protein